MWYNTKGKGSSDNMDKIIIKGARENNLKNINQDKSEINTYLTKKMKLNK